jgi:hypothetical protein
MQPEPNKKNVLKYLEEIKQHNKSFSLYEIVSILKHMPRLSDQSPEKRHMDGFKKLLEKKPAAEACVDIVKATEDLTLQMACKAFMSLSESGLEIPIPTIEETIEELKAEIENDDGDDSSSDSFSA